MRRGVFRALLVFIAACVVCVLGYLFLLSVLAGGATRSWSAVVPAFCLALAMLALNARFLRADGLTLAALGFTQPLHRLIQLLTAFLGGALLVALWAAALTLVTGARWEAQSGFRWGAAVGLATFTFFNNAAEELAYRGWLYLRLESAFGTPAAVLAPTLIFAAAHVQGGVPWTNAIAGVLTTGILYALLFQRMRSIPLVLGFHLASNLVQELLGLRVGPATLIAPRYPGIVSGAQGQLALALIAATNVALAVLLVWLNGRHARSASPDPLPRPD